MAKKEITHGIDSFNVEMLDNGFTLQYSGYDKDDQYQSQKVVITSLEDLISSITELTEKR